MKKSIWVGMSGGVDSSAAAALLKQQGHYVTGVTLRLRETGAERDIEDARRVCEALQIEHRVIDLTKRFHSCVVEPFANDYLCGRTPNPCVTCNRTIKFGALLEKALANGADAVATGHYARVEKDEKSGRYLLYRTESSKDQSYVLYSLTQHQLSHTIFPIVGMEKPAVRALAETYGLPVATKTDSMEICFVPNGGHAAFIENLTGTPFQSGNFVDEEGHILGRHKGIAHYTIGQRKGLGVAFGQPMYVVRINAQDSTVVLGVEGRQMSSKLIADNVNFIPFDALDEPMRVQAKIRYQAAPAPALLTPIDAQTVQVDFDAPQRSVTPGQAVVFYADDLVVGGGTIR